MSLVVAALALARLAVCMTEAKDRKHEHDD
jgi:hypothetical protein